MDPSHPSVCSLSIHHLITKTCNSHPSTIAIEDGHQTLSYYALNTLSSDLAARLLTLGVTPGTPIPLLATRCIDFFIGILGILKAGAVYVPVDRGQCSENVTEVLRRIGTGPGGVLVYTEEAPLGGWGEGWVGVKAKGEEGQVTENPIMRTPGKSEQSTELACFIFTSGTTGKPKGVMIRHESMVNFVSSRGSLGFGAGERFLLILSVAFDACNGYILSVLSTGGTLVLATPCNFQSRLRTCNILAATPSMLSSLEPPSPTHSDGNYPYLKHIILGGESASPHLLSTWSSPQWTIYNDYGPTEATCAVLTGPVAGNAVLGAAIPGAQVFLLDEALREVPATEDEEGEIAISGVCLAAGYWRDAVRTAEKFINLRGQRVYRTGDYGRWREDRGGRKVLEFRGRRDRVVKNRGFLVNLEAEVDVAVMEEKEVEAAYSVLWEGRLYALVAPRTVDVWALREKLRGRLAGYRVPDCIVAVDTLPKGKNGKVCQRGVQEAIRALLVREEGEVGRDVESIVRAGMAQILGLPVAAIQRDSDFVRLGGHSLAAVALASYCRKHGARITTYDILMTHTVAELVERGALTTCPSGHAAETPETAAEISPITDIQLSFIYGGTSVPGTNVIQSTMVYPAASIPCLKAAWVAVISAEPIFRTVFDVARRTQTVQPEAAAFVWEEVAVETAEAYRRETQNAPFDIGVATRFKVVTWAQQSALIWTIHHALIDGYSAALILNKVQAAAACPRSTVIPGPSFARLARELEVLRTSEEGEAAAFWKQDEEELPNSVGQIMLPRPPKSNDLSRLTEVRVATGLSLESITATTKTLGVTTSVLFYAAWAVLLSNYTNSTQVALGAVMSGRDLPLPSVDTAIGPLVNTLPLRINVDPALTSADFLRAVFLKLHRIGRFQWYSGEGTKYSSILATQYDMPCPQHTFAAPLEPPVVREGADIPLSVLIEADAIRLLYHSDQYSKADIEHMAENYLNILHALLTPDSDIDTCLRGMLAPAVRRSLLSLGHAFSAATSAAPPDENVVTLFESAAQAHPFTVAVEKGSCTLTYKTLDTASTRLARAMEASHGVRPRDVVCIHADHSINWIIGILGILKTGATYCPLDEIQPPELRADMYARSKAVLFLAGSAAQLQYAPGTAERVLAIDETLRAEEEEEEEGASRFNVPIDPSAIAYICFTSGSTGKPKGVLCEHGGLTAFQHSWAKLSDGPHAGTRFAQFMSAGFDGAVYEVFAALCFGSTLVLSEANDPFAVLKKVDRAMVTPSTAKGLVPSEHPGLKRLFIGGEAVSQKLVERWAPGRELYNIYGPTEGTILTTAGRLLPGKPVTIGRPLSSMRLYILNDRGDLTPPGVPGEIFIAGVQVAQGYIGMPDETKRTFTADTVLPRPGERMYRTGDLGYWTADGDVMFIGRKDRQVKLRGFRVDLGSVEATVVCEAADVKAAAVTVSNGALVAWVQPESTDVTTLKDRLAAVLPPYARPKFITAVNSFPLSRNGKLDYKALAAAVKPPPTVLKKRKKESPSGRTESLIAKEWQKLLGLEERNTISGDDNFVELGGHSVLQLVLAARLSKLFGLSVPVGAVINSSSLSDLARAVDALLQGGALKMEEDGRQLGYEELSPAEMDWWRKYSGAKVTSTFNVPFAAQLSSSVDRTLLARAWNIVIARHKVLHCRFVVGADGRPRRVFTERPPVAQMADKLDVWAEINCGLDLATDDLIRVLISPRQMVVVVSHIVCDLTALNVLLKEVAAVYAHAPLPPVKTTYMDVSMWSRRAAPADLDFWASYLHGAPQQPPPHSYQGQNHRGASRVFDLGPPLYRSAVAAAKKHGSTLHQLSRAAVVLTLQALTDTTDTVIGAPYMNRSSVDDQEVIGLFLEPIPMRFQFGDTAETTPCASILYAVEESSKAALSHVVPWSDLLAHLGVQQCARPVFDTVVTFHHEMIGGKQFAVPGASPFMVWTEGAKFKLLFEWTALEQKENMIVRLEYDSERLVGSAVEIVEECLSRCISCLVDGMHLGEIRRAVRELRSEMCRSRGMGEDCLEGLRYGA